MKLVHVHASAEEIGSVYQPVLGIQSGPQGFASAAAALAPVASAKWDAWTAQCRANFLEWATPRNYGGDLDLGACIAMVQERMEADSIVTVDAGNFSGWPMRFLRFGQKGTFAAPTSGAMGDAVPAAVGAALWSSAPTKRKLVSLHAATVLAQLQDVTHGEDHGAFRFTF